MFYGTEKVDYYPQTGEAVIAICRNKSSRVLLIGYRFGKNKLKKSITEVNMNLRFKPRRSPIPVHRIAGINKSTLLNAFNGSRKCRAKLAKRVENEFYEKILEVLTCRADYSSIEQHTMQ
jgi:hypothetical protein